MRGVAVPVPANSAIEAEGRGLVYNDAQSDLTL